MVLKTIYVVRHGYRSNWTINPHSGEYHGHIPTPTGNPADPALTSYGVQQAIQLGEKLSSLSHAPDVIYSSPYYRCLQTIAPYCRTLRQRKAPLEVHIDPGLGEFYGKAPFTHPAPSDSGALRKWFPWLATPEESDTTITPHPNGEGIEELHDRVAYAIYTLIKRADADAAGPRTLLICTHAAVMIALGRVLTGRMPEDESEEDFLCFTCALSTFKRRQGTESRIEEGVQQWSPKWRDVIPRIPWREGAGVQGGWECVENGATEFLDGGAERGWRFSGDEAFLANPNAFNDAENETTSTTTATAGRGSRL